MSTTRRTALLERVAWDEYRWVAREPAALERARAGLAACDWVREVRVRALHPRAHELTLHTLEPLTPVAESDESRAMRSFLYDCWTEGWRVGARDALWVVENRRDPPACQRRDILAALAAFPPGSHPHYTARQFARDGLRLWA